MKEFPIDTAAKEPMKPIALVVMNIGDSIGGKKSTGPAIPSTWLPTSFTIPKLDGTVRTLTAARYKKKGGGSPVTVAVAEATPGTSGARAKLTAAMTQPGAKTTGVGVTTADGREYTGTRSKTASTETIILEPSDKTTVIVIYASDPGGFVDAERLAQNVGNGEGLAEAPADPDDTNPLFLLPPTIPPGMEMTGIMAGSTEDLIDNAAKNDNSKESRQDIEKALGSVRQLLPDNYTFAKYTDAAGREWSAGVLDYGDLRRAWMFSYLLRGVLDNGKTESMTVRDANGVLAPADNGSLLFYSKGPYIGMVVAPKGGSRETIATLGSGLQL